MDPSVTITPTRLSSKKRTHMGWFRVKCIYSSIATFPPGGSKARARSNYAPTMAAYTHIRSGTIGPHHNPSFSRRSGSGQDGINLDATACCRHVRLRLSPSLDPAARPWQPTADSLIYLLPWGFAHALSSAPTGTTPSVT
jgi:hypothetical protein